MHRHHARNLRGSLCAPLGQWVFSIHSRTSIGQGANPSTQILAQTQCTHTQPALTHFHYQILPYRNAEQLRDFLKGGGLDVEFLSFGGGHGLGPQTMPRVLELLRAIGKQAA